MTKFKVGDKVIAKKKTPYSQTTNGWIGTVTKTRYGRLEDIYVEGKGKDGYPIGYWVESGYFNLYDEVAFAVDQIVIERTDEKTVKATAFNEGGNVIAKAKAKCSPEDKWDFYIGANLAVERLEEIVEQKKIKATSLNTEMVCIKNTSFFEDCFTVGKIYKVTNGTLTCDHNNVPVIFQNPTDKNCRIFKSVKEINAISSAIQFLEIVK